MKKNRSHGAPIATEQQSVRCRYASSAQPFGCMPWKGCRPPGARSYSGQCSRSRNHQKEMIHGETTEGNKRLTTISSAAKGGGKVPSSLHLLLVSLSLLFYVFLWLFRSPWREGERPFPVADCLLQILIRRIYRPSSLSMVLRRAFLSRRGRIYLLCFFFCPSHWFIGRFACWRPSPIHLSMSLRLIRYILPDRGRRCTCPGFRACSGCRRGPGQSAGRWETCWPLGRRENKVPGGPCEVPKCKVYPGN